MAGMVGKGWGERRGERGGRKNRRQSVLGRWEKGVGRKKRQGEEGEPREEEGHKGWE